MIRITAVTHDHQLITDLSIEQVDFSQHRWWWIDYSEPTHTETETLYTDLHFHPLAIEDCIQAWQRPKMDYYDEFSFFATHTPGPEKYDQYQIDFFVGSNFIVTYHKHVLKDVHDVWHAMHIAKSLKKWDPYRVFYEVMDNVVDNFFPIIANLEDKINEVEESQMNRSLNMDYLLNRLINLRHELLELRHTINPIRDLFYRMLNSHRLPGINSRREYFMDIYDHLLKLSANVDSNREITNDIRDNFMSINSYQQNKVIQVLTVITSIFAPLTFIAGIYGMNFVNMPELKWHYGYYGVMALMLAITVAMILLFKKKGWF